MDSSATLDSAGPDTDEDTTPEASCGEIPDATDVDAAAPCNTIKQVGTTIEETKVAETKPPWTGGALLDGTYALTAFENYTGPGGTAGPTGQKIKITFVVSGCGKHLEIAQENITKSTLGRTSYDIEMTDATTMTWKPTCPTGKAPEYWNYGVDGTTLAIGPRGTTARLVFTQK